MLSLGRVLRCQLRPPLGTAALQDLTPGLGRHACSKAMSARSLDSAGLERAFHLRFTVGVPVDPAPLRKAGKGTRERK